MYDPYGTTEKDAGYYLAHPIPTPAPPPEWKPKRHRRSWLFIALTSVSTIVILIAFAMSMFLGWQYWLSTHSKKTVPQFVSTNYTATDVIAEMKKDGCPCGHRTICPDDGEISTSCPSDENGFGYGTSITDYLGLGYSVDIQSASSITWSDPDNEQYGNAGLWVYNSSHDAQLAYTQVGHGNSSIHLPPVEYLHGRCLLLVLVDAYPTPTKPWPGYQQDLNQYCV